MILGFGLQVSQIIALGIATFLVIAFQVLVGVRIIKFKGRIHRAVHKWGGYLALAMGAIHGLMAMTLFYGWKILS